jgi:hypothetical protein
VLYLCQGSQRSENRIAQRTANQCTRRKNTPVTCHSCLCLLAQRKSVRPDEHNLCWYFLKHDCDGAIFQDSFSRELIFSESPDLCGELLQQTKAFPDRHTTLPSYLKGRETKYSLDDQTALVAWILTGPLLETENPFTTTASPISNRAC